MIDSSTCLFCAMASVTLLACGDRPGSTARTIEDSSGVEIISQPVSPSEALRLAPEPTVDFGSTGPSEFHRVSDARMLKNGGVVVANVGTAQIRVFGPGGRLEAEFGRRGRGPGEFRYPARVFEVPGGDILVADPLQLRLAIFTRSGNLVDDVAIPNRGVRTTVVGHLGGDTVVTEYEAVRPSPEEFRAQAMQYDVFGWTTATPDSLVRIPSGTVGFVGGMEDWGVVDHPLFDAIAHAATVDGMLIAGAATEPSLGLFTPAGHLVRILRWDAKPRVVTDRDIEVYRNGRLAVMNGVEAQTMMTRQLDAYPVVESFPAYEAVMADFAERVWVQEYQRPTDSSKRWYVFDLAAGTVRTLLVPSTVNVMDARGDSVLIVERDEMDVEHVRVYRWIPG